MLPSKEQRERAYAQKIEEEKAAAEAQASEALRKAMAADIELQKKIREKVDATFDGILGAIKYGRAAYYIRLAQNCSLTPEITSMAGEIIERLRNVSPPGYKFELTVEHHSYEDSRITADGGLGEPFWVHEHYHAVKITWE